MTSRDIGRVAMATLLLAALAYHAAPRLAHARHLAGWNTPVTVTGAIHDATLAPPNPSLTLEDSAGRVWHIALGTSRQASITGLTPQTLLPGKAVQAVGVMSSGGAIRAVRLMVEGQEYDIPAPKRHS